MTYKELKEEVRGFKAEIHSIFEKYNLCIVRDEGDLLLTRYDPDKDTILFDLDVDHKILE